MRSKMWCMGLMLILVCSAVSQAELVGHWTFEQSLINSGTAEAVHNGTMIGTEAYTTDTPFGRGYALDASQGKSLVRINNTESDDDGANYVNTFDNVSAFTVSMFMKRPTTTWPASGYWNSFINKGQDLGGFFIRRYGTSNQHQGSLKSKEIISSTTINNTDWHHYAITFDGTTMVYYFDGAAVGSGAATYTAKPEMAFLIGAQEENGNRNTGAYYDDVRFYDEALDAAMMTKVFNGTAPGASPQGGAHTPTPASGSTLIDPTTLQELSWQAPLTKTEADGDPNLVSVDSYDLYYYTKPITSVNADDPNELLYTKVSNAANPYAFSVDYNKTYFWRVDANVTWDSNEITGTAVTTETIEGYDWQFSTAPQYLAPVMSFNNVITTMDIAPKTLSATISNNSDPITGVTFTLLYDDFEFPVDATASISDMTTDMQNPTATLTTDTAGNYKVTLSITDGTTAVESTATIMVYADACQAKKDSPSGWTANDYDKDGNCVVDLTDFASLAVEWLDDTSMKTSEQFDGESMLIPSDVYAVRIEAESVDTADPNAVSDFPVTDDIGIRIVNEAGATGDDNAIGFTTFGADGNWTKYVIDAAAGTYDLHLVSAANAEGNIMEFGTASVSDLYGAVTDLPVSGWGNYHYSVVPGALTFTEDGPKEVRITWTGDAGRNLDWFALIPAAQ